MLIFSLAYLAKHNTHKLCTRGGSNGQWISLHSFLNLKKNQRHFTFKLPYANDWRLVMYINKGRNVDLNMKTTIWIQGLYHTTKLDLALNIGWLRFSGRRKGYFRRFSQILFWILNFWRATDSANSCASQTAIITDEKVILLDNWL